jgi:hypothetical protein
VKYWVVFCCLAALGGSLQLANADPLCNEFKRKKRQEFCKCHAEAGASIFRGPQGGVRWQHHGGRGENARMAVINEVMGCMARKGYKFEEE